MRWSRKLAKELRTRDGKTLRTLADARAYAVKLPKHIALRNQWQACAARLLEAAEGGSVEAATRQLELALFLDMRLSFEKPETKKPRR